MDAGKVVCSHHALTCLTERRRILYMTGFLCARVLATFREQTVKVEKCLFQSASISYLGFKVGPGQVKMDPEKVRAART